MERHPLLLDRPDLGNDLDCHIVASWRSFCGDVSRGFAGEAIMLIAFGLLNRLRKPVSWSWVTIQALYIFCLISWSLSCVGDNRVGIGSADFLTGVDL